MNSWWGIDIKPLINEITKLFLSQKVIIALSEQNNQSQTQIINLLQEQNQLLKKYLENQK